VYFYELSSCPRDKVACLVFWNRNVRFDDVGKPSTVVLIVDGMERPTIRLLLIRLDERYPRDSFGYSKLFQVDCSCPHYTNGKCVKLPTPAISKPSRLLDREYNLDNVIENTAVIKCTASHPVSRLNKHASGVGLASINFLHSTKIAASLCRSLYIVERIMVREFNTVFVRSGFDNSGDKRPVLENLPTHCTKPIYDEVVVDRPLRLKPIGSLNYGPVVI
jgi:hypothetical protein